MIPAVTWRPQTGCDLHHPIRNNLRDRIPLHFKLNEIQMDSPSGCQSDTVMVLNSLHGLPLGAILCGRAKKSRFQRKN